MSLPVGSMLNPGTLDEDYLESFERPIRLMLNHGEDRPLSDGDIEDEERGSGDRSPSDSLFVPDTDSQVFSPPRYGNSLLPGPPGLQYQLSSSQSSVSMSEDVSMTDSGDRMSQNIATSETTIGLSDSDTVCYGMVHRVDVKLKGQGSHLPQLLAKLAPPEGSHANHMQMFALEAKSDHILLSFLDGTQFGYLRDNMTEALKPHLGLLGSDDVSFEAIASTVSLRTRIAKVEKQGDAVLHVDINIYGPRDKAKPIGDQLSDKKVWLQRPDYFKKQYPYENPHLIRFPDIEETIQPEEAVQEVVAPEAVQPNTTLDRVQEVVNQVHNKLHRANDLDREDGDQRLNTKLLDHQRRGLTFMLQRESGDIPEEYRLWKPAVFENQETFIHAITKTRIAVRPEEKGGGVLADEMGMGKSLAILALIIRTLERAREWAVGHRDDEHSHSRAQRYSHSTLVIVPSALLINSWMSEIKLHLGDALKVVKYHGQGRERKEEILAAADVVVTTYNTLVADFAKKNSPLHRIFWYRVVLDEAHFIRRIATSFYRTCAALEANSRWCLTGTPIQNRLEDIGALFAFLKADPFHSLKVFRKHISTPFENHDTVVIERLVLLYDSLVLRRTKDIIKLPGQENHTRELDLSPDEMEQYNRTTNILNRRIRQFPGTDEPEDKFGLFQVQLQLRILCNHGTWQKLFSWKKRDLLEEVEAVVGEAGLNAEATCTGCKQPRPILGSNKIYNRFVEGCSHMLCAECLEDCGGEDITHCPLCKRFEKTSRGNAQTADIGDGESDEDMSTADDEDVPSRSGKKDDTYFNFDGHSTKMEALVQDVKVDLLTTKSIIFSCWTRTLDLVGIYLRRNQIPYLRIDGECLLSKRQRILNDFARPNSRERVMLMTTGTGAFGLNLTAANRIFIVELQWNPTVENQAIARAIRINQSTKVIVTRYKVKNTVEQEIESQQKKKKMAAQAGFVRVDEDEEMDD